MGTHQPTLLLWHRLVAAAAAASARTLHAAAVTGSAAVGATSSAAAATAARTPAVLHLARHASALTATTSTGRGLMMSGRDGRWRGLPAALLLSPRRASTSTSTSPPPAPPAPTATPPLSYVDILTASDTFHGRAGTSSSPVPPPPDPAVAAALASFASSPAARDAALALYVNAALFDRAASSFARVVTAAVSGGGPISDRLRALAAGREGGGGGGGVGGGVGVGDTASAPATLSPLFPLFAAHCLASYATRIAAYRDVVQALDMRAPHTWHPGARALTRRIIYHAGPTNSGKTHAALAALGAAASGVYCGPLRLLAVEVWDELNARGVPTRLVTGQEARDVPGARHTACTVEMADVGAGATGAAPPPPGEHFGSGGMGAAPAPPGSPPSAPPSPSRVAVAVIDEIQLIGDPGRGWAWTRALHGLAADEVHVCGDATALGLVAAIAADCGDAFEVRTYRRFRPLRLDTAGLPNGLADVRPGDCVVAFSRADIYRSRAALEAATGLRAAVVYGALPPETRRAQARRFNDPGGGADVLVASDAVGMGLNLNIRRVVFAGLTKPMGRVGGPPAGGGGAPAAAAAAAAGWAAPPPPSPPRGRGRPRTVRAPIPPPALKQIAGRAGRRSSEWDEGLVTTLDPGDLPSLAAALAAPTTTADTPAAALFPELDQLEAYAGRHPGAPLAEILARAAGEARLDGRYFFAQQTSVLEAAALLEAVPGLSLRDRFLFCAAPASPRDKRSGGALLAFATAYASARPVLLAGGGHRALLPVAAAPAGCVAGWDGGGGGLDPPPLISTAPAMKDAEDAHSIVSLYMWLARRFPAPGADGRPRWPDLGAAAAEAEAIIGMLDAGLEAVGVAGRAAAAAAAAAGGSGRSNSSSSERGGARSEGRRRARAAAARGAPPPTPAALVEGAGDALLARRAAARKAGHERAAARRLAERGAAAAAAAAMAASGGGVTVAVPA